MKKTRNHVENETNNCCIDRMVTKPLVRCFTQQTFVEAAAVHMITKEGSDMYTCISPIVPIRSRLLLSDLYEQEGRDCPQTCDDAPRNRMLG